MSMPRQRRYFSASALLAAISSSNVCLLLLFIVLFMETVLIDIADESMRARDFYFRTQTVSHYEKASWFRCVILKQHE